MKYLLPPILFLLLHSTGLSGQCPSANVTLISQQQINNFATTYSNCTDISGDLVIGNSLEGWTNIANLEPLNFIESIGGSLVIGETIFLADLTGFDNITSVGGSISIYDNSLLSNLNGLDNITIMGGGLKVDNNPILTSIEGIENIDYTSIAYLAISNNPNLSVCNVKSVCDYLEIADNPTSIDANAEGCSTRPEVEATCQSFVNTTSFNFSDDIQFYPNPTNGKVYLNGMDAGKIKIMDSMGKVVGEYLIRGSEIDISELPNGIYFLQIDAEGKFISRKIVKQ